MNNLLWIIPDAIDKSKNYISVFGFEIYYYAIAITTGMLMCVLAAIPLVKRKGLNTDFLLDLMIGIIPCSIICARLCYVLFDINSFHSFKEVINIRDGGMAIYGGVAGGALGIVIVCKIKKVQIVKIFDLGGALLPLGQSIGRWGNYFNQEVYGGIDPTNYGLPVSVWIEDCGHYHYALFLWEAILNFILFIILYIFLFKYKGKRNGYTTAFYFLGYGFIRFLMEPMRESEFNLPLFGLANVNGMQLVALISVLGGLLLWAIIFYKDMTDCGDNVIEYYKYIFGKGERSETEGKSVQAEDEPVAVALPVEKVKAINKRSSSKKE